jgi:hypothetical protein
MPLTCVGGECQHQRDQCPEARGYDDADSKSRIAVRRALAAFAGKTNDASTAARRQTPRASRPRESASIAASAPVAAPPEIQARKDRRQLIAQQQRIAREPS